ncbi:hypothetical protein, partial [Vibrio vulnificus]|uniref:hypothetical protein n=1 Tax=Vibrio vulnificus TaxID=672 RepID=UPI001F50DC46
MKLSVLFGVTQVRIVKEEMRSDDELDDVGNIDELVECASFWSYAGYILRVHSSNLVFTFLVWVFVLFDHLQMV